MILPHCYRDDQILNVSREVILSAGSIGTPHILMNSGIGPKRHLESVINKTASAYEQERSRRHPIVDLPGVGQNLVVSS